MTDLATVVTYDEAVSVDLSHGKMKTPITIWVKHIDCDAATQAGRDHDNGKYAKHTRGMVVLAACFDRWEWNGNDINGDVPDLSMESALDVLSTAKWMVTPLLKKVTDLGNFTPV